MNALAGGGLFTTAILPKLFGQECMDDKPLFTSITQKYVLISYLKV